MAKYICELSIVFSGLQITSGGFISCKSYADTVKVLEHPLSS